jgi:opacity protein-like surface antigen
MNRSKYRILLCTMIFLLAGALPATALDLGGHVRDGVVVGLGFGHGWNEVAWNSTEGADRSTDNLSAFNGAFRVGWARSDYLMASIGLNGWRRSFSQNLTPATSSYYCFTLEAHVFPRGEGFWLKGGIGRGSLDLDIQDPVDRIIVKEAGFAWTVGAGYEFRVSESTAIGVAYDYQTTAVGDFALGSDTKVDSHAVSLSINYYVQ